MDIYVSDLLSTVVLPQNISSFEYLTSLSPAVVISLPLVEKNLAAHDSFLSARDSFFNRAIFFSNAARGSLMFPPYSPSLAVRPARPQLFTELAPALAPCSPWLLCAPCSCAARRLPCRSSAIRGLYPLLPWLRVLLPAKLGPALSLSLCSCSPCRESLASSPARLHFLRSLLQLYCRAQLAPAQVNRPRCWSRVPRPARPRPRRCSSQGRAGKIRGPVQILKRDPIYVNVYEEGFSSIYISVEEFISAGNTSPLKSAIFKDKFN
jgi:hypothetical protein